MDESYEDYRTDIGYRMAIAPWRAWFYIEGGKEDFCGFAIDTVQVSGVTGADDFIDLFRGATAPTQFSPSEPIHVLKVPTSPLIQASRTVEALHPDALPVAILKYLAQIKVLYALQGQGAPLTYALSILRGDLENTGMVPSPNECPPMLEHVAPEDWRKELGYFPAARNPNGLGASWVNEDRTGRIEPLNRGRRTTNLGKAGEIMKIKDTNPTSEGAQ